MSLVVSHTAVMNVNCVVVYSYLALLGKLAANTVPYFHSHRVCSSNCKKGSLPMVGDNSHDYT